MNLKIAELKAENEKLKQLIRELNKALVNICKKAEAERGMSHFFWHAEEQLYVASEALAKVPKDLRKAGTWRIEEGGA